MNGSKTHIADSVMCCLLDVTHLSFFVFFCLYFSVSSDRLS